MSNDEIKQNEEHQDHPENASGETYSRKKFIHAASKWSGAVSGMIIGAGTLGLGNSCLTEPYSDYSDAWLWLSLAYANYSNYSYTNSSYANSSSYRYCDGTCQNTYTYSYYCNYGNYSDYGC